MEIAFNTKTNRLSAIEELRELEIVDADIYCCPDYSTPLKPVSYLKSNKKRTCFFYLKSKLHSEDCVYNENSKLIKTAQTQSTSTEEGFPFPYPSKLVLNNENVELSNGIDDGIESLNSGNKKTECNYRNRETNHHRTVSTIKNIVRHFVTFPNDRDVMLSIPFVSSHQTSYRSIFKNIWGGDIYKDFYIFYSKIFWSKPQIYDDYIEIKLMAGVWENNQQKESCWLRINIDSSNSRHRNLVLKEINTTIEEAVDKKDKVYGYLFFLGKQDNDDEFMFHVDSYKLISSIVIEKRAKLSY